MMNMAEPLSAWTFEWQLGDREKPASEKENPTWTKVSKLLLYLSHSIFCYLLQQLILNA